MIRHLNLSHHRIAVWSVIGSLMFALSLLVLSLAGISDLHPLGDQVVDDRFSQVDTWVSLRSDAIGKVDFANGNLSIGGQTRALLKAPYTLHSPGSLILNAIQTNGDTAAGYGLWWGEPGAAQYVIGVDSDGYLSAQKIEADRTTELRPWEVFPHVRGLNTSNRFQVDVNFGHVTIWLNDERVIDFEQTPVDALEFGLYVETFDAGRARFRFEQITVWETGPGQAP